MILKRIRANDYIVVDGVKLRIRWVDVDKGTSFFIPCVNAFAVIKQIRTYFKGEGWKFRYKIRVENGYFGVRIWRTL